MNVKKTLALLPLLLTLTSCQLGRPTTISPDSVSDSVEESDKKDSASSTEQKPSSVSSAKPDSTVDSTSESSAIPSSTIPCLPGERLIWSDEFDGDELDSEYWEPQIGDGSSYGVYRWGNNEAQYYKSENATVSDGALHITAKREQTGSYQYSSARIRTYRKVSALHGRVEARMALPAIQGMWPAFWMLPETNFENKGWPYSGEIDIMEAKGRLKNESSGALHYAADDGNHTYQTNTNLFKAADKTTIEDYHVYGVEWTASSMVWYCDDNEFLTVNRSTWHTAAYGSADPFDQPFHILFNLAVGGNFDGGREPLASFTDAEMKVDYVRYFSMA